jgi:glycosyltransferase involved in cell wall biosynthesis
MRQTLPKISIVTPSFNQGAFIEEALVTVKEQNYPSIEHIVFDGASTDNTVEILRRYSAKPEWGHLYWTSEADDGQADALNKGFRMATGDIVGWLNSDDRYRPGCFATISRQFSERPEADIIYGDYTWMDEKGRVKRIRREIDFSHFILSYHRVLYIATVSTFFRRRVFDDGNWLDAGLQYAMDFEFFLRLAHSGYHFQHISSVIADFRWHSQSKSSVHSRKQKTEQNAVLPQYCAALRGIRNPVRKKLTLTALRSTAAGLRYWKKLMGGCYFPEYGPL